MITDLAHEEEAELFLADLKAQLEFPVEELELPIDEAPMYMEESKVGHNSSNSSRSNKTKKSEDQSAHVEESEPLQPVIDLLQALEGSHNPNKKLKIARKVLLLIEKSIALRDHRDMRYSFAKLLIDEKTFFPVLIYCIIKARVSSIGSHFLLIEEYTSSKKREGFEYISRALKAYLAQVYECGFGVGPLKLPEAPVIPGSRQQSGSVVDSLSASFLKKSQNVKK